MIRSTNKIDGGRRQRPRIRMDMEESKLFVDPDVYLSGIVTAIAVIEENSQRHQPETIRRHRMRIDQMNIVEAKQADPRFGRWNAHGSISDFSAFVARMEGGRRLFYEWNIGRAGFAAMRNLSRTHKRCIGGN